VFFFYRGGGDSRTIFQFSLAKKDGMKYLLSLISEVIFPTA
jgi:hypothetical protein